MNRRTLLFALGLSALGIGAIGWWQRHRLRSAATPIILRLRGRRTLADALASHGPAARQRLQAAFKAAATAYPPVRVTLIALKAERLLELWGHPAGDAPPRLITTYTVRAASGGPGPKLRQGDRQVPEGIYPITHLNPNSRYAVSLRIGYPNAEDLAWAAAEGRSDPGGDIMIHGRGGSVGCLSLDDAAAEDLFVLAADVGIAAMTVLLAPWELRRRPVPALPAGAPAWMAERYRKLHIAMARFDKTVKR